MARHLLAPLAIAAGVAEAVALASVKPHHHHHAQNEAWASLPPDVCKCKNWKETYGSGEAMCGAGQEFYFSTGNLERKDPKRIKAAWDHWGFLCAQFFQRLDNNRCVNINVGKDTGTWCYVDPQCPTTQLDARRGIAWKSCWPGKDPMLRDLSPEELNATARELDVELGVLHKFSYPLSKAYKNKRFPEVAAYWGIGSTPESLPVWLRMDMQKIANTGRPYSFDNSLDERTPHTIVVGMKVYQVEDSPDKDEARPGTWETLKCIQGC